MSSPGYTLEGTQWPNPTQITFSFVPDGTVWDAGTSNLQAVLNAELGAGAWETQIAKTLATWESVANINIVPVADSGAPFNVKGLAQGDPNFGDIRIAGYNLGNSTIAAQTYPPPPAGWTAAGDSEINTSIGFSIGSGIDLYSVMLHEMGHSLGLGHSLDSSNVMYAVYQGVRSGLGAGDIAGIQSLYGPRTLDAYQQQGLGTTSINTIILNPAVNAQGQATIPGVSLGTMGDTEYYSYTAPNVAGATLQATAAAAGVSLLSPEIEVFDSSNQLLAQQSQPGQWGDNAAVSVPLEPGARYLIAVKGATNNVFSVGAYQLDINVKGLPQPPAPTAPATETTTPPSNPNPQPSVSYATVILPSTSTNSHPTAHKRFGPRGFGGRQRSTLARMSPSVHLAHVAIFTSSRPPDHQWYMLNRGRQVRHG